MLDSEKPSHVVGAALLEALEKVEMEHGDLSANWVIEGIKDFTAAVLVEADASINEYVVQLRTTHAEASIFANYDKANKVGEA